jgi:hypothetical protein
MARRNRPASSIYWIAGNSMSPASGVSGQGGKNLPLTEVEWTVARAGLEDITSHVLRHARAIHVSMNDGTLAQVARVLGNPRSVTERTCAKCQPGCLRAAVNAACGGRRVDEGAEERV